MKDIPVRVTELIQQLRDVQKNTEQLKHAISAVQQAQQEIAQVQSQQTRMLDKIQLLNTEERHHANTGKVQLAESTARQLHTLKDIEFPRLQAKEIEKKGEVVRLERQKDELGALRTSSVLKGFSALINAVNFISTIDNRLERYVWFSYLQAEAGILTLNPGELKSLSDIQLAQKAMDDYKSHLQQSALALSPEDKRDIDRFNILGKEIPEQQSKLQKMVNFIDHENKNLTQAQFKLEDIKQRKGYSASTLSGLLFGGIACFVLAIVLLVIYLNQSNIVASASNAYIISMVVLFLLGCLCLWLRYYQDKGKRFTETTDEIERIKQALVQHKQQLEDHQKSLAASSEEMEQIFTRHTILRLVDFAIAHPK